jgi:Xaa-Pro aminopeptidase
MSSTVITTEEFSARRHRAVAAAKQRGLAGLLVVSRGGGTLDRYGDVLYLTNFYTHFPFIPDFEGNWSARGHTFLVLPVNEAPELLVDVPDDGRIRLTDGKASYSDFVLDDTIAALKRAGLTKARVGLVGADVLTYRMTERLRSALPDLALEPADDILASLRSIKSLGEIALLRKASEVGSRTIEAMLNASVPDASHAEIVAAGLAHLVPAGGVLYNSFMASGKGGDPSRLARSNFPTWASQKRLAEGDWIRFGISGTVGGYMFDLARAKAVGPVTNRQITLFEAAISSVEATLAAIRPGVTAGELGAAGLDKQQSLGFQVDGVFSAMGHGLGVGWDDPWLARSVPIEIVANMVLCIERTIQQDGYLGDFEQTVLITPDGYELLTNAVKRSW